MDLKPKLQFEAKHRKAVYCLDFSPDGRLLVSGSWDPSLRIWDTATGRQKRQQRKLMRELRFIDCQFAWKGQAILYSRQVSKGDEKDDPKHGLWDLRTDESDDFEIYRAYPFSRPAVHLDSSLMSLCLARSDVHIIRADDRWHKGESIWPSDSPSDLQPHAVAFEPQGGHLAVAVSDGTIRFWNPTSKEFVREIPNNAGGIYQMTFSANDELIAVDSDEKQVSIIATNEGKTIATFDHAGETIQSMSFLPDNRELLTLAYDESADRTVRLWSVEDGRLLWKWKPMRPKLISVAISPDGADLAVGEVSGEIGLWAMEDIAAHCQGG